MLQPVWGQNDVGSSAQPCSGCRTGPGKVSTPPGAETRISPLRAGAELRNALIVDVRFQIIINFTKTEDCYDKKGIAIVVTDDSLCYLNQPTPYMHYLKATL